MNVKIHFYILNSRFELQNQKESEKIKSQNTQKECSCMQMHDRNMVTRISRTVCRNLQTLETSAQIRSCLIAEKFTKFMSFIGRTQTSFSCPLTSRMNIHHGLIYPLNVHCVVMSFHKNKKQTPPPHPKFWLEIFTHIDPPPKKTQQAAVAQISFFGAGPNFYNKQKCLTLFLTDFVH